MNERDFLTAPIVVCTIAGCLVKPSCQPCGVKTVALKWVITKVKILNIEVYDHQDYCN